MGVDKLRITNTFRADKQLWLTFCKSAPHTTFFHTPMWAELFERYSTQYSAFTRCVEFSDGTRVLIPMVKRSILSGLFTVYLSMPGCTYGGWIALSSLNSVHQQLLVGYLAKYKDLVLRENPYDISHEVMHNSGAVEDITQSIDLTCGFDKVFAKANKNHHRKVKAAQKAGVYVGAAEEFGLWEQYYAMYQESIARWKKKKIHTGVSYDLNFFKELYKIDSPYRTLWIAFVNNSPIAGILCFYWNNHAVVWHGAGCEDYFDFHPNDMVYNHAIRDACSKGYHWFDCNPSAGLEGVSNFKRSLGSVSLQAHYFNKKSLMRSLAEHVKKITSALGKDSSHV